MKKHFRKILIVALVLALVFNRLDVQAEPTEVTVSSESQLREALEAAEDDTVIVINGSINMRSTEPLRTDKRITLKKGGAYNKLMFMGSTQIEGLVFDGGGIAGETFIQPYGSTTSFTGCTFKNGISNDYGGMVVTAYGTYTFTGCTFTDNKAKNGGHIAVKDGSTVNLSECTFTAGESNGNGGAIVVRVGTTLNVDKCTITGNEAKERPIEERSAYDNTYFGYGGGIISTGKLTITDSLIYGNRAVGGSDIAYTTEGTATYSNTTSEAYYEEAYNALGLYGTGVTEESGRDNAGTDYVFLEYGYTDTNPNPPAEPEPTTPEPEDNPTEGGENKPDDPAQDNPSSGENKPEDKPNEEKPADTPQDKPNEDKPTGGNSSSTTTTDSHTEDNSTHSDNHSTDNHSTTDNHSSQSDNHSTTDSHDTTDHSTHTEDKHIEDNSKHDSHNKTDNRSYTYNTTEKASDSPSKGVNISAPITLSIPAQKATEGAKKEPEVTQATTINIYTESGKITPDGKGGYTLDLVEAEPQATPLSSGKEGEKKTDKTEVTEILLLVYLMGKDALLGVVSKLKR